MKPREQFGVLSVLFILVLLPTAALSQPYPEGMVAYWRFDEGEGNTAYDSIDGAHGSLHGDATWVSGRVGGAVSLDGNWDYVNFGTPSHLALRPPLTVEAWLYSEDDEAIVLSRGDTGFRYYKFQLSNEYNLSFTVESYPTTVPYTDQPLEQSQWLHVVGVHDGVKGYIYVNSELRGFHVATGGMDESTGAALTIGNEPSYFWNSSLWFTGIVDEVAMYDRALTEQEIEQHYQNGLNGLGYDLAPQIQCVGFEPPVAGGPIKVKGNRALPFKAQLFDAENNLVTDLDLTAPPVIQVWYEYGTPDADDVTDEALPAGHGSEGNQFSFDSDQRWHYNLKTKDYSATGTYTVFMDSGDASEYLVDPTCTGQFVIE